VKEHIPAQIERYAPDPFYAQLVRLVERQMASHRFNVTQAARAAGIERSNLSAWLQGRRHLSQRSLFKLCSAMNIVPAISLRGGVVK